MTDNATFPPSLDDEDIEQIEMIINTIEDRVEVAHKQQYVKILYEWYKSANYDRDNKKIIAIEFAKFCIKSIGLEVADATLQNDFDKFIKIHTKE